MKHTYSSGLQIAQILTSTFCASLWSHCTQSLVFGWSWARCCSWLQLFWSRSDDASALVHICARTLWIQSKAQRSGNFLWLENVSEAWNPSGELSLSWALSPAAFYSFFNDPERSHLIPIQAAHIAQSHTSRCCEFKWFRAGNRHTSIHWQSLTHNQLVREWETWPLLRLLECFSMWLKGLNLAESDISKNGCRSPLWSHKQWFIIGPGLPGHVNFL